MTTNPNQLPLTPALVHEKADALVKWGVNFLNTLRVKGFDPRLVAYLKDSPASTVLTEVTYDLSGQWGTEEAKHKALFDIGLGLYRNHQFVAGVALASEAWYVRREADDESEQRPSEAPDREECLAVLAGSTGGAFSTVRHVHVSRDAAGVLVPAALDERKASDYRHLDAPLLAWFWKGYFSTTLSKAPQADSSTEEKLPEKSPD